MTNSIVRLLVSILVRLCLWISLADALAQNDVPSCRRRFVVKSIKTFSVAAGGFTLPLKNAKAETFNNALTEFRAFRVLPDASKSLNPTLKTVDVSSRSSCRLSQSLRSTSVSQAKPLIIFIGPKTMDSTSGAAKGRWRTLAWRTPQLCS